MIRLIATDLDGTFVDDDKNVPPPNAAAIGHASERGIPFVFATGRPTRWLEPLARFADAHPYAIASNGAVTLELDTGRIVHTAAIDTAVLTSVIADIRAAMPEPAFAVEYANHWAGEPSSLALRTSADEPTIVGPVDDFITLEPVVKLIILDATRPTDILAREVEAIVGDRLTVTFSFVSETGMLELSSRGVSKASALRELLDDLSINPDNVVAFGDMPNDIEMLRLAGKGFSMARRHASLDEFEAIGDNNDGAVGLKVMELLGIDY